MTTLKHVNQMKNIYAELQNSRKRYLTVCWMQLPVSSNKTEGTNAIAQIVYN